MNVAKEPEPHQSKRQAIVDAAARVFAEKGFAGTSNREIAREAGISPGLIYWYFRDKEELFRAVMQRVFPVQSSKMLIDDLDDLPLDRLLAEVGQHFIHVLTHPDVLRLIRLALSELIRFPDVFSEAGHVTGNRVIGPLAEQLNMRVERGELARIDTWLAAQAFFGTLMGYVIRKYMYQSVDLQDTSEEAMVRTVVLIFTRGLAVEIVPGIEGNEHT